MARYQSDIARSHEEHAALQSEHESALTSQKEQLEASIAAQRDVVERLRADVGEIRATMQLGGGVATGER